MINLVVLSILLQTWQAWVLHRGHAKFRNAKRSFSGSGLGRRPVSRAEVTKPDALLERNYLLKLDMVSEGVAAQQLKSCVAWLFWGIDVI